MQRTGNVCNQNALHSAGILIKIYLTVKFACALDFIERVWSSTHLSTQKNEKWFAIIEFTRKQRQKLA